MAFDAGLLESLKSFQEGVSSLAFTRALSGATEQINQIKDSTLDQTEKTAQIRQVAQGITGYMLGQGKSPESIQAFQQLLGTGGYKDWKHKLQAGIEQNNPALVKEAQAQAEAELTPGLNKQIKAAKEIYGFKQPDKEDSATSKLVTTAQKGYNAELKGVNETQVRLDDLESEINSNSPIKLATAKIILARALDPRGRPTDAERKLIAGNQSAIGKLKQYIATGAESELTPENKQAFLDIAKRLRTVNSAQKKRLALHHAGQLEQNSGLDLPTAIRKVTGDESLANSILSEQGYTPVDTSELTAPKPPGLDVLNFR